MESIDGLDLAEVCDDIITEEEIHDDKCVYFGISPNAYDAALAAAAPNDTLGFIHAVIQRLTTNELLLLHDAVNRLFRVQMKHPVVPAANAHAAVADPHPQSRL